MTAIAAVFDGRLKDDTRIHRMLNAAAHRGPQPAVTWSSGPATLGYRASLSRDGASPAPFARCQSGNAIVFDGRLDNRDELERALATEPAVTDARLALAAYAKWAEESPAYLLGDFAFVIWDAGRRRLMCARDVFGQRPLMYASVGEGAAVASEPQQLLAHPDVPAVVNDGAIAEYLACAPTSMDETLWAGVTRLPPAHGLIVSAAGLRRFRYWDFDPEARLEYARVAEYAEHFTDLFRTAIACRCRGAASVGVFLSGGLDSSAIAGTAQILARERNAPSVRAFSLTFPGLDVDETPYIDAVVRKWDLPSVRLDARSATMEEMTRQIVRYRELPACPTGSILDPLRRRAAAEVDVVLTGYGGDDWFTGSPLHTADLLREGRVVAAARQYWDDTRLPSAGYSWVGLLRTVIGPLLPRAALAVLRPLAGTRAPAYDWIRGEFAAEVGLRDRLRPAASRPCRTYVQTQIRALANCAQQARGDESEDRAAAAAGLDQRHPFNDRRLAEFAFALPESQRWAGGETKIVMRRALEEVLPASVRRRNDKAEFTPALVETLRMLGGRGFFSRLRGEEAGWIEGSVLPRRYDEMAGLYSRGDRTYIRLADALWSVAAVELWLRER